MVVSLFGDLQGRVELRLYCSDSLDLDLATASDDVVHHIFGVSQLLLVLHIVPVSEAVEALLREVSGHREVGVRGEHLEVDLLIDSRLHSF